MQSTICLIVPSSHKQKVGLPSEYEPATPPEENQEKSRLDMSSDVDSNIRPERPIMSADAVLPVGAMERSTSLPVPMPTRKSVDKTRASGSGDTADEERFRIETLRRQLAKIG